jgi:autophagy-related protein 17
MRILSDTPLSTSLQKPGEPSKRLDDFVSNDNYNDFTASIHSSIDRFHKAGSALHDIYDTFGDSLSSLKNLCSKPEGTSESHKSPLPLRFQALEEHATGVAQDLQSLVRHFDLSVTALKHTEGGLPAATQAAEGIEGLPVSSGLEQQDAPLASITESERRKMLTILANDAAEVDDVVAEMKERCGEMEAQLEHMSNYVGSLQEERSALVSAAGTLERVGGDMRTFSEAARSFWHAWETEKETLIKGYHEVNGLREFYEGFLAAYDDLIVEARRRDQVNERMEAIVQDATQRINEIYESEVKARASFTKLQAEYLPADIWPGLIELPTKYEIVAVGIAPEVGDEKEAQIGVHDEELFGEPGPHESIEVEV